MYINYRAYPPNVICAKLIEAYGEDGVKYMAGLEYLYLEDSPHELDDLTNKISSTGALPCFC